MLEFYHDLLDKYLNRRNFDLIPMDTGSMHMAISGEFDKIVRPKLREYDHGGKAEFLSTSKYHERTPGLLAEFQGKKMITLTIKCYYANDGKAEHEISFKGVRKNRIQCLGSDISRRLTEV